MSLVRGVEDDGRVFTAQVTGLERAGEPIPGMLLVMTCRDGRYTVDVPPTTEAR